MSLTQSIFEREVGLRKFNTKLEIIESAFNEVSLSRQYLFTDINEVMILVSISLKLKTKFVSTGGGTSSRTFPQSRTTVCG